MGLAAAVLFSTIICAIGMLTRPINIAYSFLFIIIFFTELGHGFTSANGSIFFNQGFMNFMNFKVIEFMIAAAYIYVLITYKSAPRKHFLSFEKKLAILFIATIITISLVEYTLHDKVTVGPWRLLLSGMMLFHLLNILIDTREKFVQFLKVLILFVSIRVILGLLMYFAGHGVISFRGTTPFFWDDRLISGFTFCAILLSSYIIGYDSFPKSYQLIKKGAAIALLVLLAITIALCLRRTLWLMTIAGVFTVVYFSGKIKLQHYAFIAVIFATLAVTIATLPAFENTRNKIDEYAKSLNIFGNLSKRSKSEAEASTATHMYNVQQYFRIISEDPSILAFGMSGREGDDYQVFKGEVELEGPLGTPHNSVLSTIVYFGLAGTAIYLLLYLKPILSIKRVLRLDKASLFRYTALASWAMLLMELIPALSFTPAFYSSVKGCFVTFSVLFIFRASMYYGTQEHNSNDTTDKNISKDNEPTNILASKKSHKLIGT